MKLMFVVLASGSLLAAGCQQTGQSLFEPRRSGSEEAAQPSFQADHSSGNSEVQPAMSWHVCKNFTWKYEISYPPSWKIWKPFFGPVDCGTPDQIIVFGPDDPASGPHGPRLTLRIYTRADKDNPPYYGSIILNRNLVSKLVSDFGNLTKTVNSDGSVLFWFGRDTGDPFVVVSQRDTLYEFRCSGIDDQTLQNIMDNLILY